MTISSSSLPSSVWRIVWISWAVLVFIVIMVWTRPHDTPPATIPPSTMATTFQQTRLLTTYTPRFHFHPLSTPFPALHIYIITVKCRQQYIHSMMNGVFRHSYWIMEGITPSDLTESDYRQYSSTLDANSPLYRKPSKVCVHLSYLITLLHAVSNESPEDHILVLEDDIVFPDITGDRLKRVLYGFTTQTTYDVCYLGYCFCPLCPTLHSPLTSTTDKAWTPTFLSLPKKSLILCKHAIVYKTDYVRRMLLDPLLWFLTRPSDHHILETHARLEGRVCIPDIPVVYQDRQRFGSHNHNSTWL